MKITVRTSIDRPAEEVFHWHSRLATFERKNPSWNPIKDIAYEGARISFKQKLGSTWKKWVLERQEIEPGKSFAYQQVEGPFPLWTHTHRVYPISGTSCEWEEEILVNPPLSSTKRKKIEQSLQWGQETLIHDLEVLALYPSPPLKVLISGSTGLVGKALIPFLLGGGHQIIRLMRGEKKREEGAIFWDPQVGHMHVEDFEGFDAVIHLAGKGIASGRWSKKLKEEIFLSRCRDTWLLSQVLLRTKKPPKTLICASAMGIYGNRGDESLTEKSSLGHGFLADVCKKWEEATQSIEKEGTRGIHTRFGHILSSRGGILARLLPLYRLGLGAIIGKGKQQMSWIALDDLLYALYHVCHKEGIKGGVNFSAPEVVTQEAFSQRLSKWMHRPLFLHIKEKWLRFALGEMAEELFLTSQKLIPEKLLQSGFQFYYPTLERMRKRELYHNNLKN